MFTFMPYIIWENICSIDLNCYNMGKNIDSCSYLKGGEHGKIIANFWTNN